MTTITATKSAAKPSALLADLLKLAALKKGERFAGIDPKTRVCTYVDELSDIAVLSILRLKCIAVPVSEETAREIWGTEVPDIYAIAERRP